MDIATKLDKLRQQFVGNLQGKLKSVEMMQKTLNTHPLPKGFLVDFHHVVHKINGSAGTFGYKAVSEEARKLELSLASYLHETEIPETDLKTVRQQIDSLMATARQLVFEPDKPVDQTNNEPTNNSLIGLYIKNETFGQAIKEKLHSYGYQTTFLKEQHLRDETTYSEAIQILVSDMTPDNQSDYEVVAGSKQDRLFHHVFISEKANLSSRLTAVRSGADSFFQLPHQMDELVVHIDQFLNKKSTPYNVLIIEDDTNVAVYFSLILEEAGMKTKVLTNPMQFEFAVNDFHPDLFLVDMYMPKCSGIELAKIIRQQEHFSSVPIIFLSSEQNKEIQLAAMSAGVEDFVTKLTSPNHLILNINNRANRHRELADLIHFDSLTKCYNHTAIQKELATAMKIAERNKTPLSIAMIDVDHFKSVNDSYGHLAGDQVLKNLSVMIKNRLRESDKIGRHGGEEFLILLPGCQADDALQIMNNLRSKFAEVNQIHRNDSFRVTFSGGVVCWNHEDPIEKMIQQADEALYQAKSSGRNNIQVST